MSERPERELTWLEWGYSWWQWATGDEVKIAPGTPPAPADGSDGDAPPHAEHLKLGVNERFRPGIELAAQRTGMDPSAIAAIISAEAGPLRNKEKKAQIVEEAFRMLHTDRDWDKRPLSLTDPADEDLVKEYKALARQTAWNEESKAVESSALGLTQFLNGTWKSEAEREGTHLHEVAKEKGMLDADGHVLKSQRDALLELRKDPTLSIVAAAEYDLSVFDAVSDEKDADGNLLIPAGLSDDEKAKYLYICHHEGEEGAIQFLSGTLTDERAAGLLEDNVLDADDRAALVAAHDGSESAAYKTWLEGYVDDTIVPDRFRK
jgi:type VI secretion system secreted protein VgrG